MKNQQSISTCDKCMQHTKIIFNHLTHDDIEQINYDKKCQSLKKGAILYRQGSQMKGFYCVDEGIIKIFKTGNEGKEQVIKFAKKGDIIGYRSVLSGELACTSAKVLEDATVCFIPTQTLHYLIKNNSSFAIDLLQLICIELGEANCYITDIAQKTVRERLAEILILLKSNFGTNSDGELQISLTREDLANLIGTATESVIRLLSEFNKDKYIETQGRKIKILNENALKKIGNI